MKKSIYITILISIFSLVLFGACLFLLIKDNVVLPDTDGTETLAETTTPTVTDPAGQDPTKLDFYTSSPYHFKGNLPDIYLVYDPDKIPTASAYSDGVTKGCYYVSTTKLKEEHKEIVGEELIIPSYHYDPAQYPEGPLPVEYIKDGSSSTGLLNGNNSVKKINFGRIAEIGSYFAYNSTALEEVDIADSVTSIGKRAFGECGVLHALTIGEGVTSIGEYAFYNLTALTSFNFNAKKCYDFSQDDDYIFAYAGKNSSGIDFNIGENVETIPSYLFGFESSYMRPNITSVDFIGVSKCTEIGTAAFYGLDGFTSITIPSSVTRIYRGAFFSCGGLTEINYNATNCSVTIASEEDVFEFSGNDTTDVVLNIGANVSVIPGYAFRSTNITTVNFAEGSVCQSIGDRAFNSCARLITVNIPETVTSIENRAFLNCSMLTDITLPNNLVSIGDSAFYGCIALTDINIPQHVTSIGASAFYNCAGVSNIDYNAIQCADLTENNSVFNNVGETSGILTVNVGQNVKNIPAYMFKSAFEYLKTVNFEGSECERIGDSAFYECTKLQTINMPANLTRIGNYTFYKCSQLQSLEIPENVNFIGSYAFYECTNIQTINVPENVTNIGDYTFYDCANLQSVTMSENITSIGVYAFYYCSKLETINIPNNLITIGTYAFYRCYGLSSLTIPSNVERIGTYAFYFCKGLTNIEYNAIECENLEADNNVFYRAGSDLGNMTLNIGKDVTRIPNYLFYPTTDSPSSYCPKITTVNFEEGSNCESIGDYAFYYCSKLETILIPNNVTEIGRYAFSNCTALESLTIGTAVKNIGNYAFYNCNDLISIKYNAIECDDLVSSNYVFYNAGTTSGNITVNIGEMVTSIPNYLFYISTSSAYPRIVNVNFEGDLKCESIGNYAFRGCSDLELITIPNSVKSIGESAFYGCSSLTYIKISQQVTSIGNSAFYGCTRISNIDFDAVECDDLTSGNEVFYNAGKTSGAITVNIGKLVTKIPNYLFYPHSNSDYYTRIKTVNFTEDAECETIGEYAFYYCSDLKTITIPKNINFIGRYAFGESGLTNAEFKDITSFWERATSATSTSWTNINSIANATTNATRLKSSYANYYWRKKPEAV